MKRIAFVVIFLAFSCLAKAHGQNHSVQPADVTLFKGRALAVVDKLLAVGIGQVMGVDLQELKAHIPEVTWRVMNPGENKPGSVGSRSSAFYVTDNKTVTVISDAREFSERSLSILSLHESLGALGYRDENYQSSINLYILAHTQDAESKEFVLYATNIMSSIEHQAQANC